MTEDDMRAYGFAMTMTSNGGTGARAMKDGLSATAFPSGVKGTTGSARTAADVPAGPRHARRDPIG
jgi:N-methylhydantoinase B